MYAGSALNTAERLIYKRSFDIAKKTLIISNFENDIKITQKENFSKEKIKKLDFLNLHFGHAILMRFKLFA